jgi:hypothetical protein
MANSVLLALNKRFYDIDLGLLEARNGYKDKSDSTQSDLFWMTNNN